MFSNPHLNLVQRSVQLKETDTPVTTLAADCVTFTIRLSLLPVLYPWNADKSIPTVAFHLHRRGHGSGLGSELKFSPLGESTWGSLT